MKSKKFIRLICISAIFASLSIILYVVEIFSFNLPIFPSFLKFHFDEIPLFMAGYLGGPLAFILATIVKTLAKLPLSNTMCVGELCDFVLTIAFVLPAVLIWRVKRNVPFFFVGLVTGFLSQLIVAAIFTTFVMVPFYMFVFNQNEESLLKIIQSVAPWVHDLKLGYMLMIALPFNAIKNGFILIVVISVYLPLHNYIRIHSYNTN